MSRIESYERDKLPFSDASGKPRRSGAAVSSERTLYDDGLVKIIEAPSAGNIVAMAAVSGAGEEKERLFTVEEIDEGKFGADFHPVSGDKLAGLRCVFAKDLGYSVFELPVPGGVGWGDAISPTAKRLQRIGDSTAHPKKDFPLPHWHFDPYTGEELRR
jgi:hypothetical protein